MTEKVNLKDFIELDYTGKLTDGLIFDTTLEKVAKENNLFSEKQKFGPIIIIVGEKQLLPGLDAQLVGKEIGKTYTLTLEPEDAFGKRDIKRIKMIPISTFIEHKLQPRQGLQIDVDGERGVVTQVSGGRILVNFNHPLAGRKVIYEFTINRKIIEQQEKVVVFLNNSLRIPIEKIKVEIKENKAEVNLPFDLPPQFTDALGKKMCELVGVDKITFTSAKEKNQDL